MLGTRDKALLAVMLGAQVLASRSGYGLPVFLVLAMISLVVFGTREKHPSEPSAFSVFNKGHQRLAGQFTAEQFDAQLRGTPNEPEQFMGVQDDYGGQRLGGTTVVDSAVDPATRRRLFAQAAERRLS